MPRLDLCAAGICRKSRALFPEKGHQAAAAQGRFHLGRGAVTTIRKLGKGALAPCPPSKNQQPLCVEWWARGACHRARVRATRWLCPSYDSAMESAPSTVISGHSAFQRLAFASELDAEKFAV